MASETADTERFVGRWRVLMVDDDPARLRKAQETATAERVHIIPALSPVDALQVARMCHLDGVVLGEPAPDERSPAQLLRLLRRVLPDGERMPMALMAPRAHVVERGRASLVVRRPLEIEGVRELRALMGTVWGRATVLVVDDDLAFGERLILLLGRAGLDAVAGEPRQLLRAIQLAKPDLLILGADVVGGAVAEAVRVVRSASRWRHLPVLVIMGSEGLAGALRAGATGLVERGASDDELLTLVRGHLERARAAGEQIDRDPLTGLLRPRAFLDRTSTRFAGRAPDERFALGLVAFELPSHSETVYERLLTSVALVMRGDPEVIWCRWGPRELAFACAVENRHAVLRDVHTLLRSAWEELGGGLAERSAAGVSTGVAIAPDDGVTVEALLLAADRRQRLPG